MTQLHHHHVGSGIGPSSKWASELHFIHESLDFCSCLLAHVSHLHTSPRHCTSTCTHNRTHTAPATAQEPASSPTTAQALAHPTAPAPPTNG
ncbi:hypothetical protein O181_097203 [Austropuccinia psidii MF-1]|uniref:Uncharacterized protein n=1 Tax=Austropuccinia psidii MF-1 TaxID=1389203 RepID=A0A9Q3J8G0_9BASI|nr:hypothetical protein [Austropuccinia psidii MF-1]